MDILTASDTHERPILYTNARMYSITPAAEVAWGGIFAWLAKTTGLRLLPLDHPAPAPLAGLWSRQRLGCVVMCGWPFIEACPRPHLLAAPVPSPARYGGRPAYWSDLVVRADSSYRCLEETFGGTIGWTIEDSHSGFNMPRFHLLKYRRNSTERLYARSLGGLINPLGALTAVAEGRVDIAPVDSFCHDLLRASGHPVTQVTRILDRTEPSPIPVLIASSDVSREHARAMSEALLSANVSAEAAPLLQATLIERFVLPEESTYERGKVLDSAARQAGFAVPA